MFLLKMYRRLSLIICTHFFTTGPGEALEDFLRPRVNVLVSIVHPFYYSRVDSTVVSCFSEGGLRKAIRIPTLPQLGLLNYARDFLTTVITVIFLRKRFNLFIGLDPLNALSGLFLRKMGFVDRVVFYAIDYVPFRFRNTLLNDLYHAVERICAERSDWTWNLASAMSLQRIRGGIKTGTQLIVPIGSNFERIKRMSLSEIRRHRLVYAGSLRAGQGVELAVESLSSLRDSVPKAELVIIGSGPLEEELRRHVHKLGLDQYITFTGHIPDHREVERVIGGCGIGLALYEPTEENYTKYTEPGKVKLYMACGLPVVMTRVPEIAKRVEQLGAGIVVDYDSREVANAIRRLCSNDSLYTSARAAATSYASNYSWSTIFGSTFSTMFTHAATDESQNIVPARNRLKS